MLARERETKFITSKKSEIMSVIAYSVLDGCSFFFSSVSRFHLMSLSRHLVAFRQIYLQRATRLQLLSMDRANDVTHDTDSSGYTTSYVRTRLGV